ncbi:hypothetical protein FB379_10980 [Aeribacillus composti]|uniref:hypothetical protein n=1 Tax=Aeribacillus composti TaxID=1868734 RepID=UPI001199CE99|nr:hypothetical protein [Aeribacillus composti]TVZ84338.1 hypothetical protein FB379_10980 [Aeribacillus composti]
MDKKKYAKMIRYGTVAEQKYIDEFKDDFDILVINGNMISHASNAISKFVATRKFSYIIDPLTHSLQHDIQFLKGNNGKIKSSIVKMIDNFSEFVKRKILDEEKVLVPSDFESEKLRKDFALKVLNFQRNHVINNSKEKDYFKYLQYTNITFEPKWLVIPYFMMNTKNYKKWLEINLSMIKHSLDEYEPEKLAVQLVIEKDILEDSSFIDDIVEKYTFYDIKTLLLWIDDFSAFEASKLLLKNFCKLVKGFSDKEIKVYNLYGDYFSVLLCHQNSKAKLSGVCHGIEYGEKRAIVPVGGGIPVNKYYLYPIHQRIEFGRVATLLTIMGILPEDYERYYSEICDCKQCKEVIAANLDNFSQYGGSKSIDIERKTGATVSRQYPTAEAKRLCIRHFLFNKLKEWDSINKYEILDLVDQSIKASEEYSQVLGYNNVATFETWRDIFISMGEEHE